MHQLLLFCILASQAIYISIIRVEPDVKFKIIIPLAVNVLVFFCSPIQGGLSDYYCRKKGLIFALMINLISSMFFVFWLIWNKPVYIITYIVMVGMAGNVIPVAISAFKDITRKFMNFRFFVAIALFYYFLGDFSPVVSRYLISAKTILEISFVILVISIILIFLLFKDVKDRDIPEKISLKVQLKYIYHNLITHKYILVGLLGSFFFQFSFFQVAFRTEAFKGFLTPLVPIEMISGSLLAILFLKFSKISDEKIFVSTLIFVFVVFLALLIGALIGITNESYSIILLVLFGINYTLVYSTLYSLFIRKRHHHDHGKIFGLLESIDAIAYVFAILLTFAIKIVPAFVLWSISLSLFIVATIFFNRFLKHEKKMQDISSIKPKSLK
ncbi:MAG: hypothetical protein KR126chlam6_00959 [Candidatus Anoxychlamydiales bacterium]|nr:hypothetical protein [Candidatus Anoxychlamydiales bacterium]